MTIHVLWSVVGCLRQTPNGYVSSGSLLSLDYCNGEDPRELRKRNLDEPRCQEKLLGISEMAKRFVVLLNSYKRSYRKPTQVGECKNTKMTGTIILKELGKKADVSSQYVFPLINIWGRSD